MSEQRPAYLPDLDIGRVIESTRLALERAWDILAEACRRALAAEAEVERPAGQVAALRLGCDHLLDELADTIADKEAAERALADLRTAVRAWDAELSHWCDGPERDAVRALLAAGEEG